MTFRAASAMFSSASVSSLAPLPPIGTVTGDLLVGGMSIDSGSATITLPTGWAAPQTQKQMSSDGGTMHCGYMALTGAPAGSYSFSSSQANDCVAFIGAFSEIDFVTPIDASSATTTGSTSIASPAAIVAPGITPSNQVDLVMMGTVDWVATDGSSYTPPSGYTEAVDIANGNLASAFMAYKENVAAGATGNTTAIGTLAGSSGAYAAFFFALKRKTATAAITGTATASITETDVVAGGKTIIATLTNDVFKKNLADLVYVGSQSGKFAGTTSAQTVTFALSGGTHSTPQAGDFVIAAYAIGTAGRTPTIVIENTSAVAYTPIGSQQNADDDFDTRLLAAYRFMPGTPETQIRFTATATAGTGNVADAGAYTIHVFRNVDTGTPMDTTAQVATGTNGHAADPPSITPVTAGAWVWAVGASSAGTSAVHTSSDLSEFVTQAQADTNDVAIGAGFSTSDTDPAAFGGGGAGTTTDSWAAITAAIRPATTSAFDNARQAFIDGVDSAQSEGSGWDAVVKAGLATSTVVRTSDTAVTLTLSAFGSYNITAQETITVTVPASILMGGNAIVGSPTFTVDTAGAPAADAVPQCWMQYRTRRIH